MPMILSSGWMHHGSHAARRVWLLVAMCGGLSATAAQAEVETETLLTASAPQQPVDAALGRAARPQVGDATRKLLALQAGGEAASAQRYAMPEAVAQQVYARYLKSFSHPIPEQSSSALEKKR